MQEIQAMSLFWIVYVVRSTQNSHKSGLVSTESFWSNLKIQLTCFSFKDS